MTSAKKRSNKIGRNITNHIFLGQSLQKGNQEEERQEEVEQVCQIRA